MKYFFYVAEHIDDKMINNPELFIRRPVYEQKDLDCIYDYSKPEKSCKLK